MADVAKVLLAIANGELDENLGDVAAALALREADLVDHQYAALALGAYLERTGITVADLLSDEE